MQLSHFQITRLNLVNLIAGSLFPNMKIFIRLILLYSNVSRLQPKQFEIHKNQFHGFLNESQLLILITQKHLKLIFFSTQKNLYRFLYLFFVILTAFFERFFFIWFFHTLADLFKSRTLKPHCSNDYFSFSLCYYFRLCRLPLYIDKTNAFCLTRIGFLSILVML